MSWIFRRSCGVGIREVRLRKQIAWNLRKAAGDENVGNQHLQLQGEGR
jgi:hypothetical protein